MRRVALFSLLLAAGVTTAAWFGVSDAKQAVKSGDAAKLNSSANLKKGEVLIWAPGGGHTQGKTTPSNRGATSTTPSLPPPAADQEYDSIPRRDAIYMDTLELLPLAVPLRAPRKGEWRNQVREPSQDYAQFTSDPRRQGVLVVQPIGELSNDQRRAIGHLLDGLSAFFGLPAECAVPLTMDSIPENCFRSTKGYRQLNAEAVMEQVLRPDVGGGIGAILAVCEMDLYPGERWNFATAHGWSSFSDGTSVLSTLQILDDSQADRGRNLLRLTKLGIHELCHTFNLRHCSTYRCLMNGSGGLRESDTKPFSLCPDCLAKLSLATGRTPAMHLEDMLGLCQAKGFAEDAKYYLKALRIVGNK